MANLTRTIHVGAGPGIKGRPQVRAAINRAFASIFGAPEVSVATLVPRLARRMGAEEYQVVQIGVPTVAPVHQVVPGNP